MSALLTELVVTNFRSIRGTVSIPLDAQIILIHGPNGAGKTSIATALELALTGDVAALRRNDDNVQAHLVNRHAERAEISLKVSGDLRQETKLSVRNGIIDGRPLLGREHQTFYSDRCYLSQSTLGRLLDIYQMPASRDPTNTPLTNFVKSLLGLDQLESLIDGLYAAGDKRRMAKLSSDFDRADNLQRRLEAEMREVNALDNSDATEIAELQDRLAPLCVSLELPDDLIAAANQLAIIDGRDALAREVARVNSVVSLQHQWLQLATEDDTVSIAALERAEAEAANALTRHRQGPGKQLAGAINTLRSIFPDIPNPDQNDPEEARSVALALVIDEITRLEGLVATSAISTQALRVTDEHLRQHRARLTVLDTQVEQVAGDTAGLGQALASLLPHIHDDTCPVCHRDFSEVPGVNLKNHVAEEIARLVGQSDRLNELIAERKQVQDQIAQADRARSADQARALTQTDLTRHQQRLATLRLARSELEELAGIAGQATQLRDRHAAAASRTGRARLRDSTSGEIRAALADLAVTIAAPEITDAEPTNDVLSRLLTAVEARRDNAKKQAEDRQSAARIILDIQARQLEKTRRDAENIERRQRLERLKAAQRVVRTERDMANRLRAAASEARTAIVGRVFNDRLNTIWRDLFVRLAPNEPFVPAFVLPSKDGDPISALLETVHRDGGTYGRPGAMLSAGNLNTAALTLFLALHLSVNSQLPWLVLDDPVQSMDELHVAQFAALLRTLAKREDRQIIIAIHERQLFDYLALEFSPAFPGDKLITVEISKSPDGSTDYSTNVLGFEPDRLVA
ncbi:AAA family ATPase [Altererythrobacter sp. CAU 1778]